MLSMFVYRSSITDCVELVRSAPLQKNSGLCGVPRGLGQAELVRASEALVVVGEALAPASWAAEETVYPFDMFEDG